MNVDEAKSAIRRFGKLVLTQEPSRNTLRWLDMEVHAGRLIKSYVSKTAETFYERRPRAHA